MGDAEIERAQQQFARRILRGLVAEILPQASEIRGNRIPLLPQALINHFVISGGHAGKGADRDPDGQPHFPLSPICHPPFQLIIRELGVYLSMNANTTLERVRDLAQSKLLELQPFAGEEMNLPQTDSHRGRLHRG